jgi:hypothetical protein
MDWQQRVIELERRMQEMREEMLRMFEARNNANHSRIRPERPHLETVMEVMKTYPERSGWSYTPTRTRTSSVSESDPIA